MTGAATVPDLAEEDSTLVFYSLNDGFPGLLLLICVDAGCVGVAMAIQSDLCGLGEHELAFVGPLCKKAQLCQVSDPAMLEPAVCVVPAGTGTSSTCSGRFSLYHNVDG